MRLLLPPERLLDELPEDFVRLDPPELLARPPLLDPRLRLDERERPDDFDFEDEPELERPPDERRVWLFARCVLRGFGRSSSSSSSSAPAPFSDPYASS